MDRIALNKSALQKEREKLGLYQRLLPSLDLKRRQLALELNRAKNELARGQQTVRGVLTQTSEQLPMLADPDIDLSGLVTIGSIQIVEENLVGVKLPILKGISFRVNPYSFLAEPHWVDLLADALQRVAELRMKVEIFTERVRRIEHATRRITQRINLFEKLLIPEAHKNIKRIRIFLGDAERAAVVRSKISKAMHEKQRIRTVQNARLLEEHRPA